jgi:hypothetical protein
MVAQPSAWSGHIVTLDDVEAMGGPVLHPATTDEEAG